MVSLAALVLTITMVVVQLAMGQFSPRIVQPILKDKPSQFAIGIFVGTFAFAMLAMRQVIIGSAGPGQVPGLTVVVAFVLVVVSIAVLVLYVHHIGRSLRVSALIELVGEDTRRLLDAQYPGPRRAAAGRPLARRSNLIGGALPCGVRPADPGSTGGRLHSASDPGVRRVRRVRRAASARRG